VGFKGVDAIAVKVDLVAILEVRRVDCHEFVLHCALEALGLFAVAHAHLGDLDPKALAAHYAGVTVLRLQVHLDKVASLERWELFARNAVTDIVLEARKWRSLDRRHHG
jgi:hypothetical protein